MPSPLADAHIEAQRRLREIVSRTVAQIWAGLPGYDERDVPAWLSSVVPLVWAGVRQSALLTDAFLAGLLDRPPLGVVADYPRPVAPEEVYRRPFVTHWAALKEQTPWEDAVAQGQDRAVSAAVTDVQLSMRQTLVEVGERDGLILGYRRVPDSGACEFCRLVSGQRYHVSELMPVHNHCGCGVDVITEENRGDFGGKRHLDMPHGVAVHEHGELGPVLTDPSHDFTSEQDF